MKDSFMSVCNFLTIKVREIFYWVCEFRHVKLGSLIQKVLNSVPSKFLWERGRIGG